MGLIFLLHIANSAMMSTLTIHCWSDEATGKSHPPSYAETKNMILVTFRTHPSLSLDWL